MPKEVIYFRVIWFIWKYIVFFFTMIRLCFAQRYKRRTNLILNYRRRTKQNTLDVLCILVCHDEMILQIFNLKTIKLYQRAQIWTSWLIVAARGMFARKYLSCQCKRQAFPSLPHTVVVGMTKTAYVSSI